ncbi:ABC transporter permease [uncultured Gilvimarinus sp.]|uniref:ABC transporter permease n=1 Tax=uncultured Gilvimarinus sp. TaxID=1689143 RepID=UPI0030EE8122
MRLRQFFELVDVQARMSLKAEASKLYLSYLWWVLEPILYVLVFYFVFDVVLNKGRADFLLFLMCGKIPFLWFSKSVNSGSNSLVQNKGLMGQLDVPKTLFPYVTLQEVLYKQWAVFLVLFAMVVYYGNMPTLNWLWLVPLMVTQYVFIAFCTLLGAWLVSYVRDVRMLIQMGTMFMLFTSGIFWDINQVQNEALKQALLTWNPLAFLIDAYRSVLMQNQVYDYRHLAALAGVMATGLALVHGLYHGQSKRIAARIVAS